MDTQHTGSDKTISTLFSLKTNDDILSFTIKGKFIHAKISDDTDSSSINIFSKVAYSASTAEEHKSLHIYSSGEKISPLFFEWIDYEIVLIANDSADYTLTFSGTDNILTKLNDNYKSQVYTGLINFHDSIGFSDLIIYRNGEKYLIITIEVYPQKLSYKKDYLELKEDISKILYNLIYSAMEKTFSNMILQNTDTPSPTETLSILIAVYERLRASLDLIISKPHHKLISTHEIERAERVQKVSTATIKWFEKHPDQIRYNNGTIINADKAVTTRKIVVFDTKENRYAKHIINQTLSLIDKLIEKWIRYIQHSPTNKDDTLLSKLDTMKQELKMRMDTSFFKNVEEEYSFNSMSLVYSMAPGYKDLFKYYIMLRMGLSDNLKIDEMIFNLSLKGLSKLYEYWCYIKLNSIISTRYDMYSDNDIKIERSGLFYELAKGNKKSRITYKTKDKSIIMRLEYNPKNSSSSINQIPDNVFSLTRTEFNNSKLEWEFIFDAKYRIATNTKNSDYHYSAEPEDINVMHRYRDSILFNNNCIHEEQKKRKVVGAFVLYPYPDSEKEYAEGKLNPITGLRTQPHQNYRSILDQNIGAFPFLPGHTELLSRFLDQIVIESPMQTLSRTPLPAGFDFMVAYNDFESIQDLIVIILNNSSETYNNEIIEYIPNEKIILSPNSSILLNNPSTKFKNYIVISANNGIYIKGKIKHCICSKDISTNEIKYEFIIASEPSDTGKLKKRGKTLQSQVFASSQMILSCSESLNELRQNSKTEYKINYAKYKLRQGLFRKDSSLPYYFKKSIDDFISTEWPLIIYNTNN